MTIITIYLSRCIGTCGMENCMKKGKKITENELKRIELKNELERMQQDMQMTYDNLSYVVDPDLIDCYIFQLNAIQKKYKFILNQVKEEWLSADI